MPTAMPPQATPTGGFTREQKEYFEGYFAALAAQLPFVGHMADGRITATPHGGPSLAAPPAEDTIFGTPLSEVVKEEIWKRERNPLDIWDRLAEHAAKDVFPAPDDMFRFKFHGLFHVAPAQDSFMLRLRIPAGEMTAAQLRGLADIADKMGGGYAHITTRANLQIREFKPRDIVRVLTAVQDLGLTSRGSGADNIRNITASPNSGIDPDELIDVRPYAKGLHHYILNNRDLYGLPRKFNVAFDSGGSIDTAADTNDIAFMAVRVTEASLAKAGAPGVAPGVYFRVELGGITGHKDFARDTGLLLKPDELVAVAAGLIRVFNENGDRTDRKKARLKYLLGRWGAEKYLEETQKKLAFPLVRLPLEACEPRRVATKHGWIGPRRQTQKGLQAIGVGAPVGRLSVKQMRRVAEIAENYGNGELRLTVWQSFVIPNVPDAFVETTRRAVKKIGLFTEESSVTGGIVACTGSFGCKYAAADTKGHALALSKHLLKAGVSTDYPVNIHFTGCPHSCAQHYVGDIGLIGAKLSDGSEGYHVVIGGGVGHEQGIGREIFRGVRAASVPALVEKTLRVYNAKKSPGESFVEWARRHTEGQIQEMLS